MSTVNLDTTPTSGVGMAPLGARFRSRWPAVALAVICLLSAFLYAWGLGSSWGNAYYSAAVKSMSENFTNFFFGSFDPAGVITVDKPPMALWVQVLSALIFGFNKFAVLLPEVIEGVAAVYLLHRTVRRWAGENAALLAALVLALTPITVAINKDNNPDALLNLLIIAAAYALTRAMENQRRSGSWMMLAAFLVGCGFLTKMLQAWMILPAFVVAYLVGRKASWGRKTIELCGAGLMVLVSSFWWAAATVLWPTPKPYIGGSTDGSALDLIFGYNGLGRIFGGDGNIAGIGKPPGGAAAGGTSYAGGAAMGGGFSGRPGLLRMFDSADGGQISWLLPLSILILLSVIGFGLWRWRGGRGIDRHAAAGWILWGGWLVTGALMFSIAKGTIHPYYTTMLAPAIGAIVGGGVCLLWHRYRRPGGVSWLLLPLAVAVTVGWAVVLVLRDPAWNLWAAYTTVIVGILAVLGLLVARLSLRLVGRMGLALGLVAMLVVPTVWSASAAFAAASSMTGTNPMAGPPTGPGSGGGQQSGGKRGARAFDSGSGGGGFAGGMRPGGQSGAGQVSVSMRQTMRGGGSPFGSDTLTAEQTKILNYVQAKAGKLTIPLAAEGGAHAAWPFILNSNLTVVGMGGYLSTDNAPSIGQLTLWQEDGLLGFVLAGGGFGGGGSGPMYGKSAESASRHSMFGPGNSVASKRDSWVQRSCTLVPPSAYGVSSSDSTQQLYDCRQ